MRKKPQEFGFGVRDVQASPVDTFSPEVVMQPTPSRGAATGAALSSLSQTLAGVAQQNKELDDKTLKPLVHAVHAMRKENPAITDAEISQKVSESGLTTSRVLGKIRKAGGFDAFTSLEFRILYDELQGTSAFEDARVSLDSVDQAAQNLAAGYGYKQAPDGTLIPDDIDTLRADLHALYSEAHKGNRSGLKGPLQTGVYDDRISNEIDRHVEKALAVGRRSQEIDYQNRLVSELGNPVRGILDGSEKSPESAAIGVAESLKMHMANVPVPDREKVLTAWLGNVDAQLDAFAANNPPHKHQEDFRDVFQAVEAALDSIPAQVLAASPATDRKLDEVRAKYLMDSGTIERLEARDQSINATPPAATMTRALGLIGSVDNWKNTDTVRAALEEAQNVQVELFNASDEKRAAIAEKYGVDVSEVDEVAQRMTQAYQTRLDKLEGDAEHGEDRDWTNTSRDWTLQQRTQAEKEYQKKNQREASESKASDYTTMIVSATSARNTDELDRILMTVADDETLRPEDRNGLINRITIAKEMEPVMGLLKQPGAMAVQSVVAGLMKEGEAPPSQEAAGQLHAKVGALAESITNQMMGEDRWFETLKAGNIQEFSEEMGRRLQTSATSFVYDTLATDSQETFLEAVDMPGRGAAGLLTVGGDAPLTTDNIDANVGAVLKGARTRKESTMADYERLASATVATFKSVQTITPADVSAGFMQQNYLTGGATLSPAGYQLKRALKTQLDLVEEGGELAEDARDSFRRMVFDSGLASMGNPRGLMLQDLRTVIDAGAAKSGVLTERQKNEREFFELLDAAQEQLDSPLFFQTPDEAMQFRPREFQQGGKFYGLYRSEDDGLNTEATFRVRDADTGETVTWGFEDVFRYTKGFLQESVIGVPKDQITDKFVYDYLYAQSTVVTHNNN